MNAHHEKAEILIFVFIRVGQLRFHAVLMPWAMILAKKISSACWKQGASQEPHPWQCRAGTFPSPREGGRCGEKLSPPHLAFAISGKD